MIKEDIKKIINAHKEILEKYKVKSIAIFGSYVNGLQTPTSDIDFLVEFKEPISLLKHVNLAYELENIFKKKVEIVTPASLKPRIRDIILSEAMPL